MSKPWNRRPKETVEAYAAFQAYRDQENRTLAKVGKALGKSEAIMERWSADHAWVARAAAWDTEIDAKVAARLQAQIVKERATRKGQQLALARNMQAVAGMGIERLMMEVPDQNAPGGKRRALKRDMKPNEIAAVGKVGVDMERLIEGETTENLGLSGPGGSPLEVRVVDVRGLPDPRDEGKPVDAKAEPEEESDA